MQSVECASNRVRVHVFKNCLHHTPNFHPGAGWLYVQSPRQTGPWGSQQTGRGRGTAGVDLHFAVCQIV